VVCFGEGDEVEIALGAVLELSYTIQRLGLIFETEVTSGGEGLQWGGGNKEISMWMHPRRLINRGMLGVKVRDTGDCEVIVGSIPLADNLCFGASQALYAVPSAGDYVAVDLGYLIARTPSNVLVSPQIS